MQTSCSRGQATFNKVDNNSGSQKSGLIESWPRGNPIPKNQSIGKRLGQIDNLVSKNFKYVNETTEPINLQ